MGVELATSIVRVANGVKYDADGVELMVK